jgi:hypothetical protein
MNPRVIQINVSTGNVPKKPVPLWPGDEIPLL